MSIHKLKTGQWVIIISFLLFTLKANAQEVEQEEKQIPSVGIKTNLLYDATSTFNLGIEFRTGRKTSLDISGNWNPWTFSENRKWRHALVQPEFRLWTKETFSGHFFGLHAHYAYYNVGRLPKSIFSDYMAEHRFQGWLAGAGISYGYRWNFTRNWGLEATIGVGYAYMDYSKYECGTCGKKLGDETKHYFGPTKAGITLIYSFGKKKAVQPEPIYIPVIIPVKTEIVIYEPQFAVSYITPEAEAVKTRSESGQAYLDFAVNRAEIVPGYKNNAAELQKIYGLIESLKKDPDATITGITITGYASPEGTYQSNLHLSNRRATALKNQVKTLYGFPESMFSVSGQGEDWATLDTLVSHSDMTDKYAILEIIRGTDIFDGRESKLMALAGGTSYHYLKSHLFPRLRRSEYELHYTVVPFTVEKGKEVFKTNPGNLSLNEMFLIANTYEAGSDAYNEVFETAARIFPASDVANLNAAASALSRKDTVSAARYLERVTERTAGYWNNAGILAFLNGDVEKAAECFRTAQAEDNVGELDKYKESLPKE